MSEHKKGIISLIVLAWVFATMGTFSRFLGINFELFEQTYLRIGVAFLLGALLFCRQIQVSKIRNISKKDVTLLILRSVFLYLGAVLMTQAILSTKFANASLLSTLPVMPILGYIILKETIRYKTMFWIVIGFVGAAIMSLNNNFSFGAGELYAIASIFFFDLSYTLRKKHSDFLNNYEITVFMLFVGSIFLFTTSLLVGETLPKTSDFSLYIFMVIAIAGTFNILNLLLTNYGFSKVKAAVAGNILTLEIVFAGAYGVFLYKEIPVMREILGGCIIILSVYMVNKTENASEEIK